MPEKEDVIFILVIVALVVLAFFICHAIWESALPELWKIVLP